MRRSLVLLVLAWPALGTAQEMDLFGFEPRSVAMGGVQAAADGQFSAVYYNPALLHGSSFGVGYSFEQPFFHETALGTPSGSVSVHGLTDTEGYTFGLSASPGGLLRHRVTLGFGGYIPSTGLYASKLIVDGSGLYYRYANAPDQFQLAGALSVQPWDWLAVGIGAQVFGNVGGSNDFIAVLGPLSPPAPGRVASSALLSNTAGAASPEAGIAIGPFKGFRFYGAWRGKAAASYTEPINVALQPDLGNLTVSVQGTYHFTPDEVTGGVSWQGLHDRLLVAVDVAYEAWSEAPPPLAVIGIGLPPALGLAYSPVINEQTLCLVADQTACGGGRVGFSNIVYPRVGAEFMATDRLAVRAGYFFQPTFIPHQLPGPRSNAALLDSDTHVMSAGVGYGFDDPLKLAHRLVLEAALQVGVATVRTYAQDNAQGKLNYQTSGVTIDVPVSVRYDF